MSAFEDLLAAARDRRLPPVGSWQPARSGVIDIRIAANGDWFHEGTRIKRFAIAKLFATILRREGDAYYLVTPAEKLRIEVEDAPFLAVDMETVGEGATRKIVFRTNVDDAVLADAEHPITVEDRDGEPRPYVEVRNGLRALLTRTVFYRLVDMADEVDETAGEISVCSAGTRFVLGQV